MKTAVIPPDTVRFRRSAEHSSFQRFSFTQIPLFPRNPLFPACGPATRSFNGLHPKNKFLAIPFTMKIFRFALSAWLPCASSLFHVPCVEAATLSASGAKILRVIALFCACAFSIQAQAATYSISGAQILKDGVPFVAKGVNINGPNWVWARGSAQDADSIVNKWRFNLVRVNCYIGTKRATENDDLAALVSAFTSRGAVVMLEVHDFTGTYASATSSPTQSALNAR